MLQVSDAYKELMSSNARPISEPKITLYGIDKNGNQVELKWNGSNLTKLEFEWGIDVIGKTLPFLRLKWSEVYSGKLNAENYPEKYENLVSYMRVKLTYVQNLGFRNYWKTLLASNTPWKSIYKLGKSWYSLMKGVPKEEITLPSMYLTARPTISGNTITWEARDLMYFCDGVFTRLFNSETTNYFIPPMQVIVSERGRFKSTKQIFDSFQKTIEKLEVMRQNESLTNLTNKPILLDGIAKNLLLNYASIKNYYWDFSSEEEDYGCLVLKKKNFSQENTSIYYFDDNVIYKYPKITNGTNISEYSFVHAVIKRTGETKTLENPSRIVLKDLAGNETVAYRFDYDGYGELIKNESSIDTTGAVDYAISLVSDPISVEKLSVDSFKNMFYNENVIGDAFVEDNKINPYDSYSEEAIERFSYLKSYYNDKNYVLEVDSLPNFSLEPGDFVECVTNLYDGEENVIKKSMIVNIKLTYNGATKQNTILHEVKNSDN